MPPLDRVSKVDNLFVWQIVDKCKLPFPTVRSLLIRGWTYKEELNALPVWVSPGDLLQRTNKENDGEAGSPQEG